MDKKMVAALGAAGCLVFTVAGFLAAMFLARYIHGGLALLACAVVFGVGFFLFFSGLYENGVKVRQAYYVAENDNALKFKIATGLFDPLDDEPGPAQSEETEEAKAAAPQQGDAPPMADSDLSTSAESGPDDPIAIDDGQRGGPDEPETESGESEQ